MPLEIVIDHEVWQHTEYDYDANGNVVYTTFDDGSFIHTTYDHRGLRIAETDQLAKELRDDEAGQLPFTTYYHYDALGRLTSVEMPPVDDPETPLPELVRPTYEYQYDVYGNLNSIRDAKGRETTQTFDPFGRQLSRTLPDVATDSITRTESWTYLSVGAQTRFSRGLGDVNRRPAVA